MGYNNKTRKNLQRGGLTREQIIAMRGSKSANQIAANAAALAKRHGPRQSAPKGRNFKLPTRRSSRRASHNARKASRKAALDTKYGIKEYTPGSVPKKEFMKYNPKTKKWRKSNQKQKWKTLQPKQSRMNP